MKPFDVTVVVCTFNRAALLRRALESLFAQATDGWLHFEILVVDNASTDATPAVVEETARRSPVALTYVREARPGIACARNRGIRDAHTAWVAFLDDDELADPRWLISLAEAAELSGAQCFGGAAPPRLPDSCPDELRSAYRKLTLQFDWGPRLRRYTGKMYVCTCSMLIRRAVFDAVGWFDEALREGGEDTDFSRRLRAAGIEAWYTPQAVARHFIEPERLRESYLRLARLRSGLSFARRDCHRWSAVGMLVLALARLALTGLVRMPRYAWACLTHNASAQLLLRCRRWSTEGYVRGCLFLLAPRCFSPETYLAKLDFHADRKEPAMNPGSGQKTLTPASAPQPDSRDVAAQRSRSMPRNSSSRLAPVVDVLRQVAPDSEGGGWVIEPLDRGAEAHIFAVRTEDGRPLWDAHRELVVKLYRADAPQQNGTFPAQFEALALLHKLLNGRSINGWKIACPFPLYTSERPRALVMTMVPGKSLNSCLEAAGPCSDETLDSLAQAVIGAMEHYWSASAHIYGDLNFDNILCDLAGRDLSLVDPGVVEDGFLCPEVSRDWYPASRDLAHMLFETGASIKRNLGNPGTRRRQQRLMERVLRALVSRIAPTDQKLRLVDEIQACVTVHLHSLQGAWSPRGLWRVLVRKTAARRIDSILNRLRADIRGLESDAASSAAQGPCVGVQS